MYNGLEICIIVDYCQHCTLLCGTEYSVRNTTICHVNYEISL